MAKLDWRGMDDSTPCSTPEAPDKGTSDPYDTGKAGDWHGLPDGTPSSTPTTPDKEP